MKWLDAENVLKTIQESDGIEIPDFFHNRGKMPEKAEGSLSTYITQRVESFHDMLFRLIDESGMTDAQVYRRAEIDRRYFSKIRSRIPQKDTVIALGLALKLDIETMNELLRRAGYALNPADRRDRLITYCITHRINRLYTVNEYLEEFRMKTLL